MWLVKHLTSQGHLDFTKQSKYSWTGNAELNRTSTPFGSILDLFLFIHSQLHNLLQNFYFIRQIFFGIYWSQLIRHSCLSFSGVGNYTQEGTCLAVNSTQSTPVPLSCANGLASQVCYCTSRECENPLSAKALSEVTYNMHAPWSWDVTLPGFHLPTPFLVSQDIPLM